MNRKWMQLAVAVAVALPAALAAQGTPRPAPAPRARARASTPFGVFSFSGNRGRIGVIVNTAANADSDKIGARIDGVTPGGPAAKAGLKAGDIIAKFNGTSLAGVRAEDEDESGPGMKLIELAHDLDTGDTVQVEYRRGGDTRKATLVAEEVSYSSEFRMPPTPELVFPHGNMMIEPGMGGGGFGFCFGEGWCDLNLVRLNPDLGEYFGTTEGLLVIKAPADSSLPLKSGDVILSIGGRKPTTVEHAMRILRSYDAGETVSIEIMRKQKRMTLSWKVPAESSRTRIFPHTPRHNERGEPSIFRIEPKLRYKTLARAMAKARALRIAGCREI